MHLFSNLTIGNHIHHGVRNEGIEYQFISIFIDIYFFVFLF